MSRALPVSLSCNVNATGTPLSSPTRLDNSVDHHSASSSCSFKRSQLFQFISEAIDRCFCVFFNLPNMPEGQCKLSSSIGCPFLELFLRPQYFTSAHFEPPSTPRRARLLVFLATLSRFLPFLFTGVPFAKAFDFFVFVTLARSCFAFSADLGIH